jgi:hypothetical protein
MSLPWVEPLSIVADLDDDVPILSLHQHEGSGGVGMLDDIGQRLAPDAVKLRFNILCERKPRTRAVHSYGRPVGSPQCRGMPRERGHQAVVNRVTTQLEDQRAHLALHALGELSDCAEGLCDAPRRGRVVLPERLLRCACVKYRGEQRLGDRIVEIASDPAPLLQRPLALVSASFGEIPGRSLAFAHHCAEEQRGQRSDGDVELRAQRPVVDRLL